MRRIVKVCTVILVFSLVLGLAGCLMGGRPRSVHLGSGWLSRWDFGQNSSAAAEQMPEGAITALEFDLGGADVTVRGGDGFSLEVLRGSLRENKVKNGVWMLENGMKDLAGAEIVITVPRNQSFDHLNLEVGVGSLEASDVTVEQKSDLTVELGQVQFSGHMLGRTSVRCEMGDVKLALSEPEQYGYRVNSDLGAVSIDGQSYNDLDTSLEVMPDAANFYEIQCDLGNVEIHFE